MNATEEKAMESAREAELSATPSSPDLFDLMYERAKEGYVEEILRWRHWSREYPDADMTVIVQFTDGEVLPASYQGDGKWEIEDRIIQKEYTDKDVIAWAEWPYGPVRVPLQANVERRHPTSDEK